MIALNYMGLNSLMPFNLLLLLALGFVIINQLPLRQGLKNILHLSYIIRLLVAAVGDILPVSILSLPGKGKNAVRFINDAQDLSSEGLNEILASFDFSSEVWISVIAIIFFFLGKNSILILIFNCLLGTLSAYLVYLTTSIIYNSKIGKGAMLIASFFPYFIAVSAVELRESIIIYFLLLSIYNYIKWIKFDHIKSLIQAVLFSLLSGVFHGGILVIIVVYLIHYAVKVLHNISIVSIKPIKTVIGFIGIGLLLFYSYTLSLGYVKIFPIYQSLEQGTISTEFEDINQYFGVNTYRAYEDISEIGDIYTNFGELFLPFLFTPLPWQIGSKLAYFNGIFFVLGFFLILTNIQNILSTKYLQGLLLVTLLLTLLFALGTTDYAAANRHKMKIFPIVLIIVSPWLTKYLYLLGLMKSQKR